jgi:prevent-host-death family protein
MSETLPLSSVKARFSELVGQVERELDRVTVTRNGIPVAVLISPKDLESLEETLEVMSDPELVAQMREGEAAIKSGDYVTLEELQAELQARRRHDAAA